MTAQNTGSTVIIFDLETTDLINNGKMPHITQLSAMEQSTKKNFNCYVMPKVPIAERAGSLTGIQVTDGTNGPVLTVHGLVVPALSIRDAMQQFMDWLDVNEFEDAVLVAHNGERFDFLVMVSALKSVDMFESFNDKVIGFVDSLPLMRAKHPRLSSHSLVNLVKNVLRQPYDAHNAVADVEALERLLSESNTSPVDINNAIIPPMQIYHSL